MGEYLPAGNCESDDIVGFYGPTWDRFVGLHNIWIAISLAAAYHMGHIELCNLDEHGTIGEPCKVEGVFKDLRGWLSTLFLSYRPTGSI